MWNLRRSLLATCLVWSFLLPVLEAAAAPAQPAGASGPIVVFAAPHFALAAAVGDGRLATGDPDSVPVGRYARAALKSLGVWDSVANRLVGAENVRAALALVVRGEVPLGIVYRTDALVDSGVRIVDEFPLGSHPPIAYPIALTVGAKSAAAPFAAYLSTAPADAIFVKYGFIPLHPPAPKDSP